MNFDETESIFDVKCQSLIDWFKFSINMAFDKENVLIKKLFKALTLDINEYVDEGMTKQYMHKYRYGVNFIVLSEPRAGASVARKDSGLNYFFVDMSGSACREFESRSAVFGSSWKNLCNVIYDMPWHFTRDDIAVDDMGNIISLEELQYKIEHHQYIAPFRGTAKTEYIPILPDNDEIFYGGKSPLIKKHLQAHNIMSWSATFGTKQSVEFQSYDKKVEREHYGVQVPYDQWIRFEMRFRGNKADNCFIAIREALNKNEFNQLAYSLLSGLIDFKQCTVKGKVRNSFDVKHAYEYDRWKDWDNFIGQVDAKSILPLKAVVPDANKVEHMSIWDHTASGQTLALIFAASPEHFHDYCNMIVTHYVEKGKFTKTQKEMVNALRRKYGKDEIPFDEYMDLFKSCFNIKTVSNLDLRERKKIYEDEVLQLFKDTFHVEVDDVKYEGEVK